MAKPCRFFMTGTCKKENCDFLHDESLCKKYYKGICNKGGRCNYSHNFKNHNKKRNRRKKNTVSFDPDLSAPDMRIHVETSKDKFPIACAENDVILLPKFFDNDTFYDKLLLEMENCGFEQNKLWKLWHGDNHLIADDKLGNWKNKCPMFMAVVNRLKDYFSMDVKATRFNWYKDNTDWKPYHRDAAAIDKKKAKTQNITVAVSFGATRTASFQHMNTKTRIDIPLTNGSVYVFNKQVNLDWMHGIIQEPEAKKEGRISIILWGYNNQIKSY
jgi:hypothetical protein